MTAVADTNLLADLQKFGAAEINACFSCGNCTATCPMADNDGAFPRRMIRYAMVGLADELRSSRELWTCYHCGECSDACPTDADPGEFMATARRYAIASYDKTGLARLMYTRPIAGTLSGLVFFFVFASLLFSFRQDSPTSPQAKTFWDFVPYHYIHTTGLVLMVLVAIAGLAGIASMARSLAKRDGITLATMFGSKEGRSASVKALWYSVGLESIGQRRYRDDCKDEAKPVQPWYLRRWLVHALTLWGFLGLLAATTINYALDILGIKDTGTPVPIWYPVRLLGTVAGLSFLYGVTMFMI
jgi:ferredoxin